MHRLSLSRLLHLMTFVPLVALVVFGATIVVGSLRAYRDIEAVNALEDLVTAASSLTVVALNRESTATHPFVASGSESARADMMATRLVSDDAGGRNGQTTSAPRNWRRLSIGLKTPPITRASPGSPSWSTAWRK